MKTVFLALGSNIGDRAAYLRQAIERLRPHVSIEKKSRVYESEPVRVGAQPRFYNMAVGGKTTLDPHALLQQVKTIETELGRLPDTHNEPRPIDIDILLYEEQVVETPGLTIPHPRMHERAFVLMPLEEIASFHVHPALRLPVIDLLDNVGSQADTLWVAREQL